MSNYTKERNIITFHLDGVNGIYRLDLATGQFFGLKGTAIKTCQKASTIRMMLRSRDEYHGSWSNLERALYAMFNTNQTALYPRYIAILRGAERLDAIDFTGYVNDVDDFAFIDENFSSLTKYIREVVTNIQEFRSYLFRDWVIFEKAKNELGGLAEQLTPEMYAKVKNNIPNITKEEWGVVAYYLIRGKYWEYEHHDISTLVRYLIVCRAMEKQPQKVNNFMREYVETDREYELRKIEFDNNRIRENYKLHEKALNFTFGEFSVVFPTSAQDIIDEGVNMHHCVGGYVNRVVANDTYIVFVRKTDTPDQCYLTCQVDLNGNIRQYFLAYDRRISEQTDIDFYNAYQAHLKANWAVD